MAKKPFDHSTRSGKSESEGLGVGGDEIASKPSCPAWLSRVARPQTLGFCLLVCLLALLAAAKAILLDTLDSDCFWHLKVAEQLLTDGIGPLVDHLSFASIQVPWTPYSWLAELGMKALWDLGGYRAAVLCSAGMHAAFVLGVAAACRTARAADGARARFLPSAGTIADFERRPPRSCAILATGFAIFISAPLPQLSPGLGGPGRPVAVLLATRSRSPKAGAIAGSLDRRPLATLAVNLHLYAAFIPAWVTALFVGAVLERWFVAEIAERREAGRRVARDTSFCCPRHSPPVSSPQCCRAWLASRCTTTFRIRWLPAA